MHATNVQSDEEEMISLIFTAEVTYYLFIYFQDNHVEFESKCNKSRLMK